MVSSQLPAIVETLNPTSLRASEPSSQPSQEQQSLEQGHGDFPSGSTAFVHDFGPQFAFTEGYSRTAHPSVHSSHTPNPLFESAAGTTEGTHGQPQSTRRQQAQVHDTPHQKEWDQVPLFLQNTLKASLLDSLKHCFQVMPEHVLDECKELFTRWLIGDLPDPYSMIQVANIPLASGNNAGHHEDREML